MSEDPGRKRLVETSKFISFVLRHDPGAIGLELDGEGWTDLDDLIVKAVASGKEISRPIIDAILALKDKQRFEISPDGRRIRALHGHSAAGVEISYVPVPPPATLYHGTASRFLDSIREQGVHSGQRHLVHLSPDRETAASVGQRHGKPVILVIAAGDMHAAGHEFYRAANGIWLTKTIPVQYIAFPE